ncbi:MAG: hypothetical protein ABWK05_03520 [Pyrobaculum sp.]
MLCTSITECLENLKAREVYVISSPLGGLGLVRLAQQVRIVAVTSGPVFNKIAVLEAVDNYGAEVKYAPRLHTALYKLVGDKECWAAGPPLVKATVDGHSTSLMVYTCAKTDGIDNIFAGGKPVDQLSSRVLGAGRDGRDFDIVVQLRRLQVEGEDEEEIADKIIRAGVVGIEDLDAVSQRLWRLAARWKNRPAILFRDPTTGLGFTIPLLYYSVKVVASGQDCGGKCVRTTTKLVERALRMAPPAKTHEAWRAALKEPQMRRKIEDSPYIPALLLLTGKVDVKYDSAASVREYTLRTT